MSLFRDAERSQCEGKRSFPTFKAAQRGAYGDCVPYRCPHCRGWHVGRAQKVITRRPRPIQHFGLTD